MNTPEKNGIYLGFLLCLLSISASIGVNQLFSTIDYLAKDISLPLSFSFKLVAAIVFLGATAVLGVIFWHQIRSNRNPKGH